MRTARLNTLLGLLLYSALLAACGGGDPAEPTPWDCDVDYPERSADRVSIAQGVWGDVWYYEGDFMPPCPGGTVSGVGRELRIHEVATYSDVVQAPGWMHFVKEVHTKLVATVWSDAKGFYQVPLPVGEYSIFSVEDSMLYFFGSNGEGKLSSFTVYADSVTGFWFPITYNSSS